MKNIILILLVCVSTVFSADVEFNCYENDYNQYCTERKVVDLANFDDTIQDFESNWYDFSGSGSSVEAIFWDDTEFSWDDSTNTGVSDYETFYLYNNDTESSDYTNQSAFYSQLDMNEILETDDDSVTFSAEGKTIFKAYSLKDNTISVDNDTKFTINADTAVSYIQLGSTDTNCEINYSVKLTDTDLEYVINLDTCPVSVVAVDSDTQDTYQYSSNFDDVEIAFSLTYDEKDDESSFTSVGKIQRDLLNSLGQKIGYVWFNFYTNEYGVLNLEEKPFE